MSKYRLIACVSFCAVALLAAGCSDDDNSKKKTPLDAGSDVSATDTSADDAGSEDDATTQADADTNSDTGADTGSDQDAQADASGSDCGKNGLSSPTVEAHLDDNGVLTATAVAAADNGQTDVLVITWNFPAGASTDTADYDPYVLQPTADPSSAMVAVEGYAGCTGEPSTTSCMSYYVATAGDLTVTALGQAGGEQLTGSLDSATMLQMMSNGGGAANWCIEALSFDATITSDGPGEGLCRTDADCSSQCMTPPEFMEFNMCPPQSCEIQAPNACFNDADCGGSGAVCRQAPMEACLCNPEVRTCQPPCALDADCREGEACDTTTGHCGPIGCSADADCPAHYACGGNSTCERRTCSADADCTDGKCVKGACFDDFGACLTF